MVCKNCCNKLTDTQKFCSQCGAKIIFNRLTPKVLAKQVNDQFISIDNKLLQTFAGLFKHPGEVIGSYINGTRKRYIDVLQYFAIALTIAGMQFYITKTFFAEQLEAPFNFSDSSADFQKNYKNFSDYLSSSGSNFQSIVYIISVPFTAISTWITYWITNYRRFNFTEHMVINLYYSGQIVIVASIFYVLSGILGINFMYSASIITLFTFTYQYYVFKKVTNHGRLETFTRILLSYFIIGLQFLVILILIVIVILLIKVF